MSVDLTIEREQTDGSTLAIFVKATYRPGCPPTLWDPGAGPEVEVVSSTAPLTRAEVLRVEADVLCIVDDEEADRVVWPPEEREAW